MKVGFPTLTILNARLGVAQRFLDNQCINKTAWVILKPATRSVARKKLDNQVHVIKNVS